MSEQWKNILVGYAMIFVLGILFAIVWNFFVPERQMSVWIGFSVVIVANYFVRSVGRKG